MAIGTAAAIGLGVAGLGAGASALSANKASKRAAATSQANTDANVGLAREIYGQNRQIMSPFVDRGNAAGNQINALLGLGGGPAFVGALPGTQPAGAQPNALSQFQGNGFSVPPGGGFAGNVATNAMNAFSGADMQNPMGGGIPRAVVPGEVAPASGNVTTPAISPQQAAQAGFDIFKNSTNYQNRLNSAMDAVSSLYSGIGGLQSGAAIRGAQRNASNLASDELMNYFALLGGQQAVGAGSASSLAGVGQNFAGTVIGANNFNAQNQMSAQLGQQNALANVAGILGGGLFGMGGR